MVRGPLEAPRWKTVTVNRPVGAQFSLPQHCLYFFPLPHEHSSFLFRPFCSGALITGEFVATTFACRMNRRGLLPGNHLLSRNVSAAATIPPEIGSSAPQVVVVAKRSSFAGSDSIRPGFPTLSTYRRSVSWAVDAGFPATSQSRKD